MEKDKSKDKKSRKLIRLSEYRKSKTEERKREYERVLFNRMLGAYSFAEQDGMRHVEVINVSYSGVLFREQNPDIHPAVGDKMVLRFYFTPSSYLRLVLLVKRVQPYSSEEGGEGFEYGCSFDQKTKSYKVIKDLVKFMQSYSETACHDDQPPLMFF